LLWDLLPFDRAPSLETFDGGTGLESTLGPLEAVGMRFEAREIGERNLRCF